MQIGSITVEILSEGRFEIFKDGHINRSSASDTQEPAAGGESALVGINPVLVQTSEANILLDTGLGWGLDAGSEYSDVSNVHTNLQIFGLSPEDITHVVLSHLHYDHAAGCSFTDEESKTRVTFPHARYFVHRDEWDFALSQVQNKESDSSNFYKLDDFYRLVADDRVEFLSEPSTDIQKGVSVFKTGGHTQGHQIVRIRDQQESAYYLGDLLPSSAHLNRYAMEKMDADPVQAKNMKIKQLRKACQDEAILLFYHSLNGQIGRLIKNNDKQYTLAEITSG